MQNTILIYKTAHAHLKAMIPASYPTLYLPTFNHKWSMQSTSWILDKPAEQLVSMVNHGFKRLEEVAQLTELDIEMFVSELAIKEDIVWLEQQRYHW